MIRSHCCLFFPPRFNSVPRPISLSPAPHILLLPAKRTHELGNGPFLLSFLLWKFGFNYLIAVVGGAFCQFVHFFFLRLFLLLLLFLSSTFFVDFLLRLFDFAFLLGVFCLLVVLRCVCILFLLVAFL